jgi:hypothetical protein
VSLVACFLIVSFILAVTVSLMVSGAVLRHRGLFRVGALLSTVAGFLAVGSLNFVPTTFSTTLYPVRDVYRAQEYPYEAIVEWYGDGRVHTQVTKNYEEQYLAESLQVVVRHVQGNSPTGILVYQRWELVYGEHVEELMYRPATRDLGVEARR